MINEEIVKQSIVYFNENKKTFFEQYSKGITVSSDKLAIFTAGMSGVTRREIVTHRKVPKDVFLRSNENSYKTVLAIKDMFENDVILNFLDKRDNQIYNDIDSDFIKNIIGGDFEIR